MIKTFICQDCGGKELWDDEAEDEPLRLCDNAWKYDNGESQYCIWEYRK